MGKDKADSAYSSVKKALNLFARSRDLGADDSLPSATPSSFRRSWVGLGWIKDLAIAAFVITLSVRVAMADCTFDLSKLDGVDVVAIILALFAIVLSALFYFKTTDTSERFYDNTYRFTKEMGEILGRIEAKFGEQLGHIQTRVEKFPVEALQANRDVTQQKVKEVEEAKQKVIDDLMARAKLSEDERKKVEEGLRATEAELSELRMALRKTERRLRRTDLETGVEAAAETFREVREAVRRRIIEMGGNPGVAGDWVVGYLKWCQSLPVSRRAWFHKRGVPLAGDSNEVTAEQHRFVIGLYEGA